MENSMIEGERLLTEKERKIIIANRSNNKTMMRILVAFLFILLCIVFVCFIVFPSIRIAFVPFMLLICFGIGIGIWTNIKMDKLLYIDKIYVREAIFESCNKYHDGVFQIKRNGKLELYSHKAQLNEKVTKGDKVVLIPFQKMLLIILSRSGE